MALDVMRRQQVPIFRHNYTRGCFLWFSNMDSETLALNTAAKAISSTMCELIRNNEKVITDSNFVRKFWKMQLEIRNLRVSKLAVQRKNELLSVLCRSHDHF